MKGGTADACASVQACYHRACYFGCFEGASTSVFVLPNDIEAVMVLTLHF